VAHHAPYDVRIEAAEDRLLGLVIIFLVLAGAAGVALFAVPQGSASPVVDAAFFVSVAGFLVSLVIVLARHAAATLRADSAERDRTVRRARGFRHRTQRGR